MERRAWLVCVVVGVGASLAYLFVPEREGWSFDFLALSIALVAVLGVRISTDGGAGIARTRLLVVAAAALVPQAIGAMQLLRDEPTHTGLLTVATCVLFVLVVLRVSGLSRSVEKTAAMTENLARRQSEARFASLVQHSSDVVTVVNADSTVRWVSPSVERVLGHDAAELKGTRLTTVVHPEDRTSVLQFLVNGGAGADGDTHPALTEFRLRHREGFWVHVETLGRTCSTTRTCAGSS
jgi:PAS domain S-box-containing protein